MTHVYYRNADFCLIMFDLNDRESFRACAKWKTDLDEKYRLEDGSKCPCLLIGNKVRNFYSRIKISFFEPRLKKSVFLKYLLIYVYV